jgi:hypothetical protein
MMIRRILSEGIFGLMTWRSRGLDNVKTLLFKVVKFTRRRVSLFLSIVYLSISVYTDPERSNVVVVVFNAANAVFAQHNPIIPEVRLEDTVFEFPPEDEPPHVITLPSVFSAANAVVVEYTATTPELKLDDTELESPPEDESPHVITLPSVFSAANAVVVEYTATTPELKPDNTEDKYPHVITLPSLFSAANE